MFSLNMRSGKKLFLLTLLQLKKKERYQVDLNIQKFLHEQDVTQGQFFNIKEPSLV